LLCRQVGASRTLAWLFESMAAAALRRRHHGAGVFAHHSERSMPERADVAFGVLNAESANFWVSLAGRQPGWSHRGHKRPSAHASLAFSKSLGLTIQRQKREARSLRKLCSNLAGQLVAILRLKLGTLGASSTTFADTRRN